MSTDIGSLVLVRRSSSKHTEQLTSTDLLPGFAPHTDDIVEAILQGHNNRHPLSQDTAGRYWFSNPSGFSPG